MLVNWLKWLRKLQGLFRGVDALFQIVQFCGMEVVGTVFDKTMVEGLFASKVSSMKYALDVLAAPEGVTGMDQGENLVATYCIFREEADELVSCLENYSDSSLTKRHREARQLFSEFLDWCEGSDLVKLGPGVDGPHLDFVRRAVGLLTAFHLVMADASEN